MASGRRHHRPKDEDETLSRLLARVLRHEANRLGLPIQPDGFIFVDTLLQSPKFSSYSESDIKRVVNQYENHRFTLETDRRTNRLKIKANQAHSIDVPELELQEVTSAALMPVLIHLTTEEAWECIRHEGLKRMKRQHIHFSPGEEHVYRSKLPSCKIRIYLDTAKAMAGGIKFFRSDNNVILSPGNQNGTILPKFFKRVELCEGGGLSVLM